MLRRSINCFVTPAAVVIQRPSSIGQCRSLCRSLFPETISLIRTAEGADVYLVGTAHVSRRSAEEVGDLIRLVKPDLVFLELCPGRAAKLRTTGGQTDVGDLLREHDVLKKLLASPSALQVLPAPLQAMVRVGAMSGGAPNDMLLGLLRQFFKRFYSAFRSYGLIPGLEFKVAMEEAEGMGAALAYGDRSESDTLSLLLGALQHTDIMGCLTKPIPLHLQAPFAGGVGGLEDMIEKMKSRQQIAAMRDYMELTMPAVMDALVHSRDQIMVENLVRHCQESRTNTIVAVVGMAHMDGIEAKFLARSAAIQSPS